MATAVAMAGGGQDFMVAQDARSRLWAWNVSALKLAYEHWNDSWLLEDTEAWWKRRAIIISLENHWKMYHKANNQFKAEWFFLTLYTLTSVCIFSILFSIHFLRSWKGEFVQQSQASILSWWSLPLFSCVIQRWYCWETLVASHS